MDKLAMLEPRVKISIAPICDEGGHAQFGPGVAALCRGVRELGSLNAAAKQMHMAYSKAWKMMGATEQSLGVELISRDGARGSTLTPEGERLLDAYDRLRAEVRRYAALEYGELVG